MRSETERSVKHSRAWLTSRVSARGGPGASSLTRCWTCFNTKRIGCKKVTKPTIRGQEPGNARTSSSEAVAVSSRVLVDTGT